MLSGSLALLADAGHMLADVAGLSLALVAAVQSGLLNVRTTTGGRVIPVPPGQTGRICAPRPTNPAHPVLHENAS